MYEKGFVGLIKLPDTDTELFLRWYVGLWCIKFSFNGRISLEEEEYGPSLDTEVSCHALKKHKLLSYAAAATEMTIDSLGNGTSPQWPQLGQTPMQPSRSESGPFLLPDWDVSMTVCSCLFFLTSSIFHPQNIITVNQRTLFPDSWHAAILPSWSPTQQHCRYANANKVNDFFMVGLNKNMKSKLGMHFFLPVCTQTSPNHVSRVIHASCI